MKRIHLLRRHNVCDGCCFALIQFHFFFRLCGTKPTKCPNPAIKYRSVNTLISSAFFRMEETQTDIFFSSMLELLGSHDPLRKTDNPICTHINPAVVRPRSNRDNWAPANSHGRSDTGHYLSSS